MSTGSSAPANQTATQFAPTSPLHSSSGTSRALLIYGLGAGALGLLALGALGAYARRQRWRRSREKRISFGIDHDGDSDDTVDKELGGGASSVPLMTLTNSDEQLRSQSHSRSRTTSVTFAPLPVPAPRDSAFFFDPSADSGDTRGAGGGVISLNDPLPPPRSPNNAVHTHYTAAAYLPALVEAATPTSPTSLAPAVPAPSSRHPDAPASSAYIQTSSPAPDLGPTSPDHLPPSLAPHLPYAHSPSSPTNAALSSPTANRI